MSAIEAGTHRFRVRMIKAISYMEIEAGRRGFGFAARLLHIASYSIVEHETRRLLAAHHDPVTRRTDDA